MYNLESIENQFANIEAIKAQVIQAKKVQLHPNIEGFESPNNYGIYRHTGGKPLGVVGHVFNPMDLGLFVDTISSSILECGADLDLSKLKYTEFKEGAKVQFEIPYKSFQIKSPMVGDVLDTKLTFSTGFDGLTKTSLSFFANRLWCSNGAKRWDKDIELSVKNTINNQAKALLYCSEIAKCLLDVEKYVERLNELTTKAITQADIDKFVTKLTGYDVKDYNKQSTKRQNILDKINQSIAIEMQNTKVTEFSLLQGVTRYTTHELAKGNEEALMFDNAAKLNAKAHSLLMVHSN